MIDRLYEQIGGTKAIGELVRIFYKRVLDDPRLAPFFPATDMEALRAKQVMFLIMLLGSTRTFKGPDLSSAHAAARAKGLTDDHFDAVLVHFGAALAEMGVDEDFAGEILARIESSRDAVMGRPTSSAG